MISTTFVKFANVNQTKLIKFKNIFKNYKKETYIKI